MGARGDRSHGPLGGRHNRAGAQVTVSFRSAGHPARGMAALFFSQNFLETDTQMYFQGDGRVLMTKKISHQSEEDWKAADPQSTGDSSLGKIPTLRS